uniref:Uncharacterized protein n=1 Tax=Panagrolaimus sp. JU765 TaxID=591449 RepID=A0AC34Q0Z3_9BILA
MGGGRREYIKTNEQGLALKLDYLIFPLFQNKTEIPDIRCAHKNIRPTESVPTPAPTVPENVPTPSVKPEMPINATGFPGLFGEYTGQVLSYAFFGCLFIILGLIFVILMIAQKVVNMIDRQVSKDSS